VPVGAQLTVRDEEAIEPGTTLAKISREVYKTRDITGGLPRVAELFEARKPKDPSVITEIDGSIRFGEIKRGKREIVVVPNQGAERVYEVPVGKHLRVHEGDAVRAGDRRIKGPRAVQEYLLNEVQEVYRLQGVKINDKHIGVIVRQMLQKVRITDSGDSEFLEGEHVDRTIFRDQNQSLIAKGKTPARSEPLLLGITKASLTTQSFISAASFQETTRVLTDAAVRGARDELVGLKENIIIGHLIPAGTGIFRGQDVEFQVDLGAGIDMDEMTARERELFPGLAENFDEEVEERRPASAD
jgi:DNA-directed RNA polymerase subunit beta'